MKIEPLGSMIFSKQISKSALKCIEESSSRVTVTRLEKQVLTIVNNSNCLKSIPLAYICFIVSFGRVQPKIIKFLKLLSMYGLNLSRSF